MIQNGIAVTHSRLEDIDIMTEEKGSWGGSRPGAGNPEFKPKWKSGKTTVIRVPEAIASEVLAVARQIDDGKAVTLSNSKPEAVDSTAQHESVTQLKELYQKAGELEASLFKARQELQQVTQERDEYFDQIGEIQLELENLKSETVTQSSEVLKEEVRRLQAVVSLEKQQKEMSQHKLDKAQQSNKELVNLAREARAELERLQSLTNSPDPAAILNRLRKERRKSKADLKDVELILELLQAIAL